MNLAILITCHNRKNKTLKCIDSIYKANLSNIKFNVFLVDDGSTDGTNKAVKSHFPDVNIINGDGHLYWAGGMRLCWENALSEIYNGYLLLNDDVVLYKNFFVDLIEMNYFSLKKYKKEGVYVGSTIDLENNSFSYGGHKLLSKITGNSENVVPNNQIQECDFANANILYVSKNVVNSIGILSNIFTHSLADFDYTLKVKKTGFPILVFAEYCGTCKDDHGKNWLSSSYTFKQRINYLMNPKYLAFKEYRIFVKTHFPFYWPVVFLKLCIKTVFPFLYDIFKK